SSASRTPARATERMTGGEHRMKSRAHSTSPGACVAALMVGACTLAVDTGDLSSGAAPSDDGGPGDGGSPPDVAASGDAAAGIDGAPGVVDDAGADGESGTVFLD